MYLILIFFTHIIYIKKSIKYDSKTSDPADLSVTALITSRDTKEYSGMNILGLFNLILKSGVMDS